MQPPTYMREFYEVQRSLADEQKVTPGLMCRTFPVSPAIKDSIVLSRNLFRAIQGRLFRLFKFWDAGVQLRQSIKVLESDVLFADSVITKRLKGTENVAEIAYWFFFFQRNLQKKIVSNVTWTSFLSKNQGMLYYQNNPRMRSTFEIRLAEMAGIEDNSVPLPEAETLELIDRTCLMMKKYVDIYGDGKKENLTYKWGIRGGSGRGPVDDYNLLCDVLFRLNQRGAKGGIKKLPGHVQKFLAKDIMSWNNSWCDDAFANGKIPGWGTWIAERGLTNETISA